MNKKIYIILIVFMILLIFTSNIVNAKTSNFTSFDDFKIWVLHSKGSSLFVDRDSKDYEKQLKSVKVYLDAAQKTKDGNYEIYTIVDGVEEYQGYLTEAELKKAKSWVNDGCPEDAEDNPLDESIQPDKENGEYYENNTQYQKTQIYNDVKSMIGTLYSASTKNGEINYGTYLKKLKSQLNSVKDDKQYTGELQEYRISLYEEEIAKATALKSVIGDFKNESDGMTSDEVNDKITALNSRLNQLKNMPDSYTEDSGTKSRDELIAETEALIELYEEKRNREVLSDDIYKYPNRIDASSAGSLDDMIGDADSFLTKADSKDDVVTAESLQGFSKTFYNILLTVGIIVAVLVGLIIGIRFMIGGAEAKANVKELLIPYIVGCVVVFGAFAIWKIVVTILSGI